MAAAVLAALMLVTGGCSGSKSPKATPTPSPAVVTNPPSPSPAPTSGGCYRMTFAQASKPTGGGTSVDCSQTHTAVTFSTGELQSVQDGHLMAVDSDQLQRQLASTCPQRLTSFLGGTQDALRLSRFETVWFSPTVQQADRGARWYRCDVVALASNDRLATLSGKLRGVLAQPSALDRWGTCGTTAPSAKGFAKVICSAPHQWRAITVINIAKNAHYLGTKVTAQGNSACKSAASARAAGALSYKWSFQWPGADQWAAGERYGLCWVPDQG